MPMDDDELAEMQSLVQVARKRPVNFAVCMGKKPEGTVFYMHRKKEAEILARLAKKAGETAKIAAGTCEVKGKKILMTCTEDPPPAIARHMKLFLRDNGLPFKISILDSTGAEIESSGEDEDEADAAGAAAAPGPEADADVKERAAAEEPEAGEAKPAGEDAGNDDAAKKWTALVAKIDPIYVAAMGSNPANRTQLEAAWAMANEKADAQDYPTAMKIVAKILPALQAAAKAGGEAAPDPLEAQWSRAAPEMAKLFEAGMKTNPPSRTKLEAAWAMANEKADAGDYKSAMAVVAKLRPPLEALAERAETGADNGQLAAWTARRSEMEDLYTDAMKTQPADASKYAAAWAMATEKADGGDFAAAMKISDRLEPLLRAAIEAGANAAAASDTGDIPTNVVAFQRSRIEWIDTRRTMQAEMKKLEGAITAVCANNPELAPIVSQVNSLSERLSIFDDRLQDILEEITVTPEGDSRTALKRQAQSAISDYQNALNSDFFKDVDSANGFANVNVAGMAKEKLGTIAKALAG